MPSCELKRCHRWISLTNQYESNSLTELAQNESKIIRDSDGINAIVTSVTNKREVGITQDDESKYKYEDKVIDSLKTIEGMIKTNAPFIKMRQSTIKLTEEIRRNYKQLINDEIDKRIILENLFDQV